MKRFLLATFCFVSAMRSLTAEEIPAIFKGIFTLNQPRKAEVIIITPPAEIEKYVIKIEQSKEKDPKWFEEYIKSAKRTSPLPFHEKLGLTKEEYDAYIVLWAKNETKVAEDVQLILRHGSDNRWNLFSVGSSAVLTSLRYSPTEDTWKSTNGTLKRIDDINADASSILGAWKGKEWRFAEETMFSKIKENFAVGESGDGKYTMLVYRAQEITSAGTPMLDKSLFVRLPKIKIAPEKPTKKP